MKIHRSGLLISLFFMSPYANSALIDQGITTLDESTGLIWLVLSQTVNYSVNDMLVELGTGGEFEGYRYATRAEVEELFRSTLSLTITNGNSYTFGVEVQSSYAAWHDALKTLGPTVSEFSQAANVFGIDGFINEVTDGNTVTSFGFYLSDSDIVLENQRYKAWDCREPGGISCGVTTTSSQFTGHYLVQPVPVPAAIWLFGSGLLGLIGIARHNKS